MPDTICLPPLASSTCILSSFFDFFIFSQAVISPVLSLTFAKSSIEIIPALSRSSSSLITVLGFIRLSSSVISLFMSILGKRTLPFFTVTSARRTPNVPSLSKVISSAPAPICSHTSGIVAGIKGLSSAEQIRIVSSRL